jgi:hypothetical protein
LTGVKTVVRLKRVNVWGLISPTQVPNWSQVLVPSGFDEAA